MFSPRLTVLPLQGSGTTATPRGTTVEDHGTTVATAQAGTSLAKEQYYRSPLRYYRKAGGSRPGKGADEINYIRAYFH